MRVEAVDMPPDAHAGHILFDTFDIKVLAYIACLIVCVGMCTCTGWRLRRKDSIMDAKKRE